MCLGWEIKFKSYIPVVLKLSQYCGAKIALGTKIVINKTFLSSFFPILGHLFNMNGCEQTMMFLNHIYGTSKGQICAAL